VSDELTILTRDDTLFGLVWIVHAPLIHTGYSVVTPSCRMGRGLRRPIHIASRTLRDSKERSGGREKRGYPENISLLSYTVMYCFYPSSPPLVWWLRADHAVPQPGGQENISL
jgi:hypothetical protein